MTATTASPAPTWHAPSVERVAYVAACPACRRDCTWIDIREDARVHSVTRCACGGAA